MPDKALMVDIETMDTCATAAILTIGAVIFDPFGLDTEDSIRANEKNLFKATISLEDNQAQGRTFSAGTIAWWLQQEKAAQDALFQGHIDNLKQALTKFRMFIQQGIQPGRIWAKSPDFDCVILQNAFNSVGIMWPFKFWESRCVRTVTELAYPEGDAPVIGVGVAHNALDDSIRQALMVQHCNHVLQGNVQPAGGW